MRRQLLVGVVLLLVPAAPATGGGGTPAGADAVRLVPFPSAAGFSGRAVYVVRAVGTSGN